MNKKFLKNKKILITGCTGFTGSWLILYLKFYGAKIYGYSKKPPFNNSIFDRLSLKDRIIFKEGNINDLKKFKKFFNKANPDLVFHLAANPIVKDCHESPIDAFLSNSIGTLNLLESVRNSKKNKKISLNIITTDKVYKNYGKIKKFTENDILGGDDPYSASKVCAEMISKVYYKSYFQNHKISLNVFRSGNIIGGGDWSNSRLIPDIIKSCYKNKTLIVRNPNHIRPWQHIFDVINSYFLIAKKNYEKNKFEFHAWNIGPSKEKDFNVNEIINLVFKRLQKKKRIKLKRNNIIEKKNLSLNSNKIWKKFKIKNKIKTLEAINLTVDWYVNYFEEKDKYFSEKQLKEYLCL